MLNQFKTWFDKPKPVQYYFVKNGIERKVVNDPKGWEGEAIGLDRGEYHGMDRELSFDLDFFGIDAEYLKSLFDETGLNTELMLKVVVQNNDLSLSDFTITCLDFSQYKRDPKLGSVSIPTKQMGVAQLIDSYKNAEYQLDFPADENLHTIVYSGLSRESTNDIQLGVGELRKGFPLITINGSRVNRNYSESLKFTDSDGAPFTKCRFTALTNKTIKIYFNIDIDISMEGLGGVCGSGRLVFIRHNGKFQYYVQHEFPRKRHTHGSFSRETYTQKYTMDLPLIKGWDYELVYKAGDTPLGGYWTEPHISFSGIREGYFTMTEMASSPKQNYNIKGVTFGWAINSVLKKIYTDYYGDDSNLIYNYKVDRPVLDLLTSASAIRGLDEQKITFKLSDLFKNLNILTPISIKCENHTIFIGGISDAYISDTISEIIPCSDIKEEATTDDIYNIVEVGTNFTLNSQDKKNGLNESLCKNTYTLKTKTTTDDNKYDLVLDYICSPTQIEEYITDSEEDDTTTIVGDTDIYMFACETSNPSERSHYLYRSVEIETCLLDNTTVFNLSYSPKRLLMAHKNILSTSVWKSTNKILTWQSSDYDHSLKCKMRYEDEYIQEGVNYELPSECIFNPIRITANICKEIRNMDDARGDAAYSVVKLVHQDTGEEFLGFINKATFSVQYKMKKEIELKGYDINQ